MFDLFQWHELHSCRMKTQSVFLHRPYDKGHRPEKLKNHKINLIMSDQIVDSNDKRNKFQCLLFEQRDLKSEFSAQCLSERKTQKEKIEKMTKTEEQKLLEKMSKLLVTQLLNYFCGLHDFT